MQASPSDLNPEWEHQLLHIMPTLVSNPMTLQAKAPTLHKWLVFQFFIAWLSLSVIAWVLDTTVHCGDPICQSKSRWAIFWPHCHKPYSGFFPPSILFYLGHYHPTTHEQFHTFFARAHISNPSPSSIPLIDPTLFLVVFTPNLISAHVFHFSRVHFIPS